MPQKEEKSNFIYSFSIAILFCVLMWMIFVYHWIFKIDLGPFGVLPHSIYGLLGIITSPFVHEDFIHLLSNTFPFFMLCIGLFYFYRDIAWVVFLIITLMTGTFVWLIAPSGTSHIGASGLIYGFAAFLFFSGIFSRNIKLMALSAIVFFLYGSMIWGVLPGSEGISWQSHLGGFISGLITALIFFQRNKSHAHKDHLDDENQDEHYFGIKDYIEVKSPHDD